MSKMRVEFSCKTCRNVFSMFVREASEQNGRITCSACDQMQEYRLADIRKLERSGQLLDLRDQLVQ
jgi:protein-arginine kinase activator protein McsA